MSARDVTNPYQKSGPTLQPAEQNKSVYKRATSEPLEMEQQEKRAKSSNALQLEMHDLTKASNTEKRTTAALFLLKAYRKCMNLPATPTAAEFEVDNLRVFFVRLCNWAESRPIPIHFDEDLNPTTDTNRCCTEDTLAGYVGQILQWLRRQIPDHEEFAGLNPKDHKAAPEWWSHLRSSFIENCVKFQNVNGGDHTFGLEEIRPLYRDLGWMSCDPDTELEWDIEEHPLSRCDLKSVMLALIKGAHKRNNNLEMAAMINSTYRAVGRGGKVNFQTYNDWKFDYFVKILDTMWRESKNATAYGMPRVADDEFAFDFFFIHGAHGMGADGFVRTPEQIRDGKEMHVYPSLHSIHNNSVSAKMTTAIRNALLECNIPAEIVNRHTAKSLRQAGINELAMHKDIGLFEASAISGHSVGNNLNSYMDVLNPIRALPAAQAMSLRRHAHTRPVIPRFSCLGEEALAQKENLLSKMFNITLKHFKPGGNLRIVIEIFACALLRHHDNLRKLCGSTNYISGLLGVAARNAKITDSRFPPDPTLPRLSPELLIMEWGRIIQHDYEERLKISCRKAEGVLDTAVAPLHSSMSRIEETVTKMAAHQAAILNENVALRAQVHVLSNSVEVLRNGLVYANDRLASIDRSNHKISSFIRTPDKVASENNVEPPPSLDFGSSLVAEDLAMEEVAPVEQTTGSVVASNLKRAASHSSSSTLPLPPSYNCNTEPAATIVSSATAPLQPRKSAPVTTLSNWNHDAEQISSSKKTDGNFKVYDLLIELRKMGCINKESISKSTIPDICKANNKCYFRYSLALIEFLSTTQHEISTLIYTLADRNQNDTDATVAAQSIATACFKKMNELDGVNGRKSTVLALGGRVREYKKMIADAKQAIEKDKKTKYTAENVSLVELEELERLQAEGAPAPGTPDGFRSMMSFTVAKKKLN